MYPPFQNTGVDRHRAFFVNADNMQIFLFAGFVSLCQLVRTQSLNVLPLKPGVGQYIAIHATLTAMDFLPAYFYPPGPFTCIFPKSLPIFPVFAVANTWFVCRPAE